MIGPVCDGDPGLEAMIAVARAKGWAVLDRFVADGYVLDMAGGKVAGTWPRSSTLKKKRFHEKHLATHGALGWHYATGEALIEAFDAYAKNGRESCRHGCGSPVGYRGSQVQ